MGVRSAFSVILGAHHTLAHGCFSPSAAMLGIAGTVVMLAHVLRLQGAICAAHVSPCCAAEADPKQAPPTTFETSRHERGRQLRVHDEWRLVVRPPIGSSGHACVFLNATRGRA